MASPPGRGLFRDPVSGLTHLAGAFLGLVGLIFLTSRDSVPPGAPVAALVIYGVSMVLLYAASSAYHLLHVPDATRVMLRRLDHAMVPVFIAGTYTPFCIIALPGALGMGILGFVWGLALAGLFKSLYWLHAPRWVTAGVYVLMGWVIIFAVIPLAQAISATSLWLLFTGGVFYSVGALIYARKWPNPWPPHFGFHEVWHLFVLGGSACHYVGILALIGVL